MENLVSEGSPNLLSEEREILSRDTVDWIVMLCARGAYGPPAEIVGFTDYPEIIRKTTILFPYDLYNDDGFVANVIRCSWSPPLLYTEEQLASCSVVAECKGLARERTRAKSRLSLPIDDLPIL